jgi:hypothetical protein
MKLTIDEKERQVLLALVTKRWNDTGRFPQANPERDTLKALISKLDPKG